MSPERERRSQSRRRLAATVVVCAGGNPVDFGRARDLSAGGMRLRGLAAGFPKRTRLELEVRLADGESCRVPVVVTHSSRHGDLGVRFDNPDVEVLARLQRAARPRGR